MTTMASHKSPASRFFIQPFIQTQIKENIKAPRHWPLCGEFTGTGEFPTQRASCAENVSIWWRRHEDGKSSLNLPHATRHLVIVSCDNSEFTTASWGYISSPQGNRRVAPPQLASPNPLWPLSLVCIYWSGLSSAPLPPEAGIRLQTARDATALLVDPTGATTTETGTCADALVTHATWGVCLTSEAHRAPVQIPVPFKDFKQKPWWTPRFTLNSSLRLLPARTLFLAFSYMLCMSRTSHSSTPSLPRTLQMTRLGAQSNAFFQMDKGYVQCLIDGIKFFLQLAYNEYGVCGAVSRHEAKLHVIDAHLLS